MILRGSSVQFLEICNNTLLPQKDAKKRILHSRDVVKSDRKLYQNAKHILFVS